MSRAISAPNAAGLLLTACTAVVIGKEQRIALPQAAIEALKPHIVEALTKFHRESPQALGLDASEHDPLAGLAITTEGFRRIGAALAGFRLPTVLVQEGGYLSDLLGQNLTAVLAGFESVR